ncbi:D-glycero-beta-D-manno-heptose 1,7-bisphosphate 7-phosphatase [Pseudofrancisella aestuarii]|uniref:D,D-heptose 1,7-bisphosphate phosphatase n=1 Tax=Pseudofrancisella aestuarii TaxID=2670347 RepID=A0ABV9TBX3_9GAMM|nr:D-glycero-beta-D-manno-heptose 1,7-bisphosphate 7-phosphatase [Pseudofrancisella aestuarii]
MSEASGLLNRPSFVILDRDGVINVDSDHYIKSVDEWVPEKGSIEAIIKLSKLNIPVAVATNQSGIGRGYFSYAEVLKMHAKFLELLGEDANIIKYISLCPHLPEVDCDCRKPKTGLLTEIAAKLNIAFDKNVFFVGDSFKDIEVARKVGCTPVLVKTGKGKKVYNEHKAELDDCQIYENLDAFVETIK